MLLTYCLWWMGSWLLEKWSHHVCRIVLFLIFLYCWCHLFSFQNHRQDFSKTCGLVVSMLLVFSVFCVLFFFDHCIVCPMWRVSINCPFCCFLRFIQVFLVQNSITGWIWIGMIYLSGATCLPTDCCLRWASIFKESANRVDIIHKLNINIFWSNAACFRNSIG
jgi:hypothetical protein